MDELFGVLCVLSFVLLFVTLIGHGIWVVVALLWRLINSPPSDRSHNTEKPKRPSCPVCGEENQLAASRCQRCGAFISDSEKIRERVDLLSMDRQLERLFRSGHVDEEQYASLRALVARLLNDLGVQSSDELGSSPLVNSGTTSEELAALTPSLENAVMLPMASDETAHEKPAIVDAALASPDVDFVTAEAIDELAAFERSSALPTVATSSPRSTSIPFDPNSKLPEHVARPKFADMLQSFMEEKNIRWGELLSGILIVVSAVGLVISLRATLKDAIPYFPALMFMLITAAIHFAGVYSLRRWNLKSTSRGVLIIATLLIPLNFIAAVLLSGAGDQMRELTDPTYWIAILIGLAAFATMNYFAARSLVRVSWWRIMVAVLGTSVSQLILNRITPTTIQPARAAALLAFPLAAYLIAMAHAVRVAARRKRLTLRAVSTLFLEGAIATFAVLTPIGLILSKVDSLAIGLANMSPTLGLFCGSILAWGLVVHLRARQPSLAAFRTAGTSIAFFGAMLLTLLFFLAWPQPHLLIAVGLVNAVLLISLAFTARLPLLNVAAIPCLALSVLVAYHRLQNAFVDIKGPSSTQLLNVLLLGRSSIVLSIFAALSAVLGIALLYRHKIASQSYILSSSEPLRADLSNLSHGLSCLIASVIVAVISFAGAIYAGFFVTHDPDTQLITILLGWYSIVTLAAAIVLRRQPISWVASVNLYLTILHAFVWNHWLRVGVFEFTSDSGHLALRATILHSLTAMVIAVVLAWRQHCLTNCNVEVAAARIERAWSSLIDPFCWSALFTSCLALPFVFSVPDTSYALQASYVASIAATWLVTAQLQRNSRASLVGQSFAMLAVALSVIAFCTQQDWWQSNWVDPRLLQAQFIAFTVWCGLASFLRQANRAGVPLSFERMGRPVSREVSNKFTQPIMPTYLQWRQWLTFDQIVFGAVLRAFCVMGFFACLPDAYAELTARDLPKLTFPSPDFPLLASSLPAWFACAAMLVTLGIYYRERPSRVTLAGALILLATIPFHVSARFSADHGVASSLRWTFALYAGALAIPATLWGGLRRAQLDETTRLRMRQSRLLRGFAVATGIVFVCFPTLVAYVQAASGQTWISPSWKSAFLQMSPLVSHTTPLLILTAVFAAFAIRQRREAYVLLGFGTTQLAALMACVLVTLANNPSLDLVLIVRLLPSSGLAASLYLASVWAIGNRLKPIRLTKSKRRSVAYWRYASSILIFAPNAALLAMSTIPLLVEPSRNIDWQIETASWLSYASLLAAIFLGYFIMKDAPLAQRMSGVYVSICGLFVLFSISIHSHFGGQQWSGYHALFVGLSIVVSLASAMVLNWHWREVEHKSASVSDTIASSVRWASVLCVFVVAGAVRGTWQDPQAPWWSCGLIAFATAIVMALGWATRSQQFAYAATALAGLGVELYLLVINKSLTFADKVAAQAWFVTVILWMGCTWLATEIWYQKQRQQSFDLKTEHTPVHKMLAVLGTLLMLGWFWLHLVFNHVLTLAFRGIPRTHVWEAELAAVITLGLLLIGCLWDRLSRFSSLCLYAFGTSVLAFLLEFLGWRPKQTIVAIGVGLASYAAITGQLWKNGVGLCVVGQRCGIPEPVAGLKRAGQWLPLLTLLLTLLTSIIAFLVVLFEPSRTLRVSAALCPFLCALGIVQLLQKGLRRPLQFLTLYLLVASAVLVAWSDVGTGFAIAVWITRLIRLVMTLAAASVLYGGVFVRTIYRTNDWRGIAQRCAVYLAGGALFTLLLVLGLEVTAFVPGQGAPVNDPQVVALSVVLIGLVVSLLSMAVIPGQDTFSLTESQRRWYVYAAQFVAALLFAHLYLAKPYWFDGVLRPWWPYILMVIAFCGVGVGELFQRLGLRVLAEPLQRTGAFLPLLPLVSMWTIHSESDFSLVLFTVGLLYVALTIARRSWISGVAAAVSGNAALWSFLHDHTEITLWSQPQFWLIPPAASVLVAAQLNRDRLSNNNLTTIRYLCMLVIYISSTSEIFIRGIGQSVWPPMILATLAIIGAFLGIALQVRAFLFMGCSFVLLAMISMVWHASRSIQHSWPWWAFGFISGLMILVFFGVFEKKRAEIMQLAERIRRWEQ